MRHHRPLTRAAVTLATVIALGAGGWTIADGLRSRTPPAPSAADALPVTPSSLRPAATPPNSVTPGPVPSAVSAPPNSAAPPTRTATGTSATTPTQSAVAMPSSPPVRIRIPRLGVDSPVMRLDADAAGHLAVPPQSDANMVGWYEGGPSPGSAGNAIMDGHVDTRRGPAVFYGLGALHKGAAVLVTRADRTVAEFTVYAVEVYAKSAFPDQRVYGPTRDPELRLLTCGGVYTKATGYQANVVVYARLLTGRQP
ncbi:class F sortase [Actinacidiphila acidipaludis]|uniref:Class F sortase n=1 Tax=Actinacidiphila acidipaludis TaxID=2873382 RepID=A0ABS7Q4B0_9ACTN|nr:class F sortase [Streptomyces acidipaludis]MBY8877985.1 class F sortase [Streptomyces acidipaludis]